MRVGPLVIGFLCRWSRLPARSVTPVGFAHLCVSTPVPVLHEKSDIAVGARLQSWKGTFQTPNIAPSPFRRYSKTSHRGLLYGRSIATSTDMNMVVDLTSNSSKKRKNYGETSELAEEVESTDAVPKKRRGKPADNLSEAESVVPHPRKPKPKSMKRKDAVEDPVAEMKTANTSHSLEHSAESAVTGEDDKDAFSHRVPGERTTLDTNKVVDINRMVSHLEKELSIDGRRVHGAVVLFREGCTLPFIARYRKEQTGEMTEDELRKVELAMDRFQKLCERKAAILTSVGKAGMLSDDFEKKVDRAATLAEVEDLYLPFKPKKKTRASAARSQGLQPLADVIIKRAPTPAGSPSQIALKYVKSELGMASVADALAGARDIVAEEVTEVPEVRAYARAMLVQNLGLVSKERKKGADEAGKYHVYHSFEGRYSSVRPHQVLAMLRGDKEGVLSLKLVVCPSRKDAVLEWILGRGMALVRGPDPRGPGAGSGLWDQELRAAVSDGLTRLLIPVLEREWWRALSEAAEEASLQAFSANLRNKLLQPPVKGTHVLAIDPGAASGCKVALVDQFGKVLDTLVIHPMRRPEECAARLKKLLEQHGCTTIALGNGSYSRETEQFLKKWLLPSVPLLRFTVVDESGASVYSASDLAVKELPELDVTLRGAVSLARRVQDPLAEYVKIDPKSIGVGMYQHDVDQKLLAAELAQVVSICVNSVGVDVNTASPSLLQYIAGLKPAAAAEIVRHRESEGPFKNRKEIGKVKGIGKKTFEQAAGFLRVYDGSERLDSTAIHPESYPVAKKMQAARVTRASQAVAKELGVGLETMADILGELNNPVSDPRERILGIPPPLFLTASDATVEEGHAEAGSAGKAVRAASTGLSADKLVVGSVYKGTVRNVVDFGAFVDIGVQCDGLIHVSKMPKGKLLQVGAPVEVRVCAVEVAKSGGKTRISLSMID